MLTDGMMPVEANRTDASRHSLEELRRLLRQQMPHLGECCQVRSLGVFGSYVRGEQRPNSDLDVLVEFEAVPSLLSFIHLQNHLSDLLGVSVDLVMRQPV